MSAPLAPVYLSLEIPTDSTPEVALELLHRVRLFAGAMLEAGLVVELSGSVRLDVRSPAPDPEPESAPGLAGA